VQRETVTLKDLQRELREFGERFPKLQDEPLGVETALAVR
jgi:hypothetical protein